MANLKEIRSRIKSVKNIQKVTKAMKMVAAAKLRKAQENMEKARPYESRLKQLTRGRIMVEILKQNQYVPMPFEKQVLIIYAGLNGYLDEVPLDKIAQFESELLEHITINNGSIFDAIKSSGKLEEKNEEDLKNVLSTFVKTFN